MSAGCNACEGVRCAKNPYRPSLIQIGGLHLWTPPVSAPVDHATCVSCGEGYSYLSFIINAALGVLKATIGVLSGSRALMVAALYNLNDLMGAVVVSISIRLARRPADETHPYGYGQAEFIAVGIVSIVLIGAVFFMLFYTTLDILRGVPGPPHLIAIGVAILSLCTSTFLYRRGHCAADRIGSPALHTSAVHNHADAEGSLLVVIGVTGAVMGFHVLDQIVAVLEVVHIAWVAGSTCARAIKGLIDRALIEDVGPLRTVCEQIDGVSGIFSLRTRQAGNARCADVTVLVSPAISVDQAGQIAERVRRAVVKHLGDAGQAQIGFKGMAYAKRQHTEVRASV